MRKTLLLLTLLLALFSVASFAQVTVSVQTPASTSSTVPAQVEVKASAKSSHTITAWHIYVDQKNMFGGTMMKTAIDTTLTLATGKHNLIVRAWDSTGAYGSYFLTVNVDATLPPPTPPDAGPQPPSNATALKQIQNLTQWGSCDAPSCSGSTATASGSWWFALNRTSPSLTGASTEFHADGTAGEDVLWHHTLPTAAGDDRTHFLYDFNVYMPAGSTNHVIAFEHDILGIYNGQKYNFSTQCHITDYTNKQAHWDTYDGYNHHWKHTSISCAQLLKTGMWHHVKVYGERTSDLRVHYLSFTTDGQTVQVPDTYAYFSTLPTTWPGHWVIQVQIDLLSGNTGSSEYYDKATLFSW